MKTIISAILGVAMSLALSPLLAGQEPAPDKEKQKQEEPKKQEPQSPDKEKEKPKEKEKTNPEKPKQEAAPPAKEQKQDEKRQQQADKERQKQQKEQSSESAKQQRTTTQQNNQRQSAQQGHSRGQKIPEDKFRADFGREHHFRVTHRDDRRFEYDGFWFEAVQAWPTGWLPQDDCYIEEDGDNYYLVDLIHPEFRILVIVVEA